MRKGIYVLPSLLTIINLSVGFLAIVNAVKGNFSLSAWLILIAIVFDILDGRIARLTKSTSRFGIEFDSLADLISFGIAPAILVYQTFLVKYTKMGETIILLFVIAGTLRLARFNIKAQSFSENDIHFQGLPIPAAAGLLASVVLVYQIFIQDRSLRTIPFIMKEVPSIIRLVPLVVIILAYLMISNFRYSSFKRLKLDRRRSFRIFILLITLGLVIFMYPENIILIIFISYILSGVIDYLLRIYILHKRPGNKAMTNDQINKKQIEELNSYKKD